MGQTAIKFPAAVGQLLRQRRKEMGFTLRQVSDRLAERGERVHSSVLHRVERGQADPGVKRLYMLLHLYQLPPSLVSDLVELESLATKPPESKGKDLEKLEREGVESLKKGNIAQALGCLFAVRQFVPDTDESRILRQQTTITFATTARNLGKCRLAKQVIDDLLLEPPDPSLAVRVLTVAASIWRGLGSADAALGFVRQAETYLDKAERKEVAWVMHQKAALLFDLGRLDEAASILRRVLAQYRQLEDGYGELRAMYLRVRILDARGRHGDAIRCARRIVRMSETRGLERVVVFGQMALGPLLVKTGRISDGIKSLRAALEKAVSLEDRNAEFLLHYHLWKAHQLDGDTTRAQIELRMAAQFVGFVDDRTPEIDEVRLCMNENTGEWK
jgi:tetratricopeptide (TPR) repeat protein